MTIKLQIGFKKSAEQGNAEAQDHLSIEYALGEIVEKDMKKVYFFG